MRIALVGHGRWGRNHARVLAAMGRLAAVVDPDPAQRVACTQLYPKVRIVSKLGDLDWSAIDGMVIASPIEHHVDQALVGLERGKACLVEKPIALNRDDVTQLMETADAHGALLVTGHILEFHPAVNELVRYCRQEQLGDLRYWHSRRARLVPPRNYVGVAEELLWHDLSVLLRITGRLPDRIDVAGNLQDDGALSLGFGDFYATLAGSQIQPLRESSILVSGGRGTIRFDDELPPAQQLQWQLRSHEPEYLAFPQWEPLAAELEHFVAAARGAETPRNGAEQALDILTVLEMARSTCAI